MAEDEEAMFDKIHDGGFWARAIPSGARDD
jgi:hypothetical protein